MSRRQRLAARAGAVVAGVILDGLVGEPPTSVHPVALFGRAMGRLESIMHRDRRLAGLGYAGIGLGVGALAGRVVPLPLAVWSATAGAMLRSTALEIEGHLRDDDLGAARLALPSLVGRDPSDLDASGISAAVIESVAENSVDAVVAPLLWALAVGGPGVGGYRAANTLDAMVGHRSPRHENFGWASARLDDVANWLPARAFVALVVIARPRAAARILTAVRRDGPKHPSPNAGRAEAAVAAALDIELGGPLMYGDRFEDRPRLGAGRRPEAADIGHAARLADDVERLMLIGCAVGVLWTTRGRAREFVSAAPRIPSR